MFKRIVPILFMFLVGGAGVLALNNQQEILDHVAVSQAEIDPAVTQLVVNSGMNQRGIFIYHATTPRLEDSESFSQSCTRQEEHSAILGCYANDTIHIYDIQDERLAGVREVTATHEALHAIFARTSASEQARLGTLLEAEYTKAVMAEPELASRMEYYERTQPGERTNELHSIIGTEVLELSSELEEYYRMYFSDRSKVVNLHQQYKHKFDELRGQATRLEAELNQLMGQLNSMVADYDARAESLSRKISNFNARAAAGDFSSQAAFNAERSALSREGEELEVRRSSYNGLLAVYNEKIVEYNQSVSESNSMYEALDSTLQPSPQI